MRRKQILTPRGRRVLALWLAAILVGAFVLLETWRSLHAIVGTVLSR